MRDGRKEPLYRKVNTRARGHHHRTGPDFAWMRNSKDERRAEAEGVSRGKMKQGVQRGLDYTPLYRFLLSKVGQDWAAVHSEAVARLDREEPIFHMVALSRDEGRACFMGGESAWFSGLYVDDDNRLALVDPTVTPETLEPTCACCTHTLNGKPLTRPYRPV